MSGEVMKAGKHKGQLVVDVPIEYFAHHVRYTATPARYVIEELERRSKMLGSRDALEASAILSKLLFRQSDRSKAGRKKFRKMLSRNRSGRRPR